MIKVVPYDPHWPQLFEDEALQIKSALGDNCISIHHIGSTSIPGMSAKPIIDILPVVVDIREVDNATHSMELLGYTARGEYGIAFRRFFQKGSDPRTHNVHVYQEGDPEIQRYLKFREWMLTHPEDVKTYAKLKQELAAKYPNDILRYVSGKDAFVASIDGKDGYEGWRMVQALTDREWAAVHALRKQYYASEPDPIPPSELEEPAHLVLYKNAEIFGYAHIQLWSKEKAALRLFVIHENYRNQGWGSRFLSLCERWLVHRNFTLLLAYPCVKEHSFFRKHGYADLPYDDPNESQEIQMCKVLT
jgi:GrpB-like predicted nucleotidyltransferase (UPF0157 family)